MLQKLEEVERRFEELTAVLGDPEVASNATRFAEVAKERSRLEPTVEAFRDFRKVERDLAGAKDMVANESDDELRALAKMEFAELEAQHDALRKRLMLLLVPPDPFDEKNVILEIRAGTGGEEASLFAGDLFRMYSRYAESRRWRVEVLSAHEGMVGGFKEVIALISGDRVFSYFKFESGVHRVQRVPVTESQGRIHTSACTVAILPEADDVDVDVKETDLRIDVYRSSGAGGQHVNTTDSAVRITHIPSGIVVTCQDERSQHKNRAKAMKILRARLLEAEEERVHAERSAERKSMVGSGDRSERIRTYNFPQNRLTDHRIGLTLYKLEQVMNGDLGDLVDALSADYQARMLEEQEKARA
jgi:peptide chain release factor 1